MFTNASPHDLDWVTLEGGERELSVGVLVRGGRATMYDINWPKLPDLSKLTFKDEKTRKNYTVPLSLTNINQQVRSGKCKEVTIRILDYDKAEIVCQ